jgi:hypothetical protein
MQAQQHQSTVGKSPLVTRSVTHSAGFRRGQHSTRTGAAGQHSGQDSARLELRAFDGRGNLLLRDPQFDGDLAAATRHVVTLASALAERHGWAYTEVRETPTGRLLASAEGGAL